MSCSVDRIRLMGNRLPLRIITANLIGNAVLVGMLPLAAAAEGVAGLAACLCGIGLFQAPMVPAISALYSTWMPKSERAFALALPELGSKIGAAAVAAAAAERDCCTLLRATDIASSCRASCCAAMVFSPITVPLLAAAGGSAGGWRLVAYVYAVGCAGLGVLWQAVAANTPADWPSKVSHGLQLQPLWRIPTAAVSEHVFGHEQGPAVAWDERRRARVAPRGQGGLQWPQEPCARRRLLWMRTLSLSAPLAGAAGLVRLPSISCAGRQRCQGP